MTPLHRPDTPRPEYPRPDDHRPDYHRPDYHRPDYHRPDYPRPDDHRGRHPRDLDQTRVLRTTRAGATATGVPPALPDSGDVEPRLNLSLTQILAGTTAAVIAALLGSRLGVAGTLTGAALASVVSAVGSAIFGHSLLMTRRRLKAAAAHVRSTGVGPVSPGAARYPASADAVTVVLPAVTRADLAAAAASWSPPGASVADKPTTSSPTFGPIDPAGAPLLARLTRQWRKALLVTAAASVAVFGGAVVTVTVAEAIKGSPLSGGAEGGLSVLGGAGGEGGEPTGAPETGPAPSVERSTTGSSAQDAPTTQTDPTAGSGDVTTPPSDPTTEASSQAQPTRPTEPTQPPQPTGPSPTPSSPPGTAEQTPGPTAATATGGGPTTASVSPPAE